MDAAFYFLLAANTVNNFCNSASIGNMAKVYYRLLVFSLIGNLGASTSSYNVYNYDFTSPVFTPDGFLKQVEYASDAASQSSPIIFHPFLMPSSVNSSVSDALSDTHDEEGHYDELALIVASIHSCNEKEYDLLQSNVPPKRRGQNRIIDLPISVPYSNLPDKNIILGLSGLLPDSMELVSSARDHVIQSLHSSYGIHNLHHSSYSFDALSDGVVSQPVMASSSSCAFRLAQYLASKCQERAFGGGLRAFGSTIVLCGVDFSASTEKENSLDTLVRICVVDPSGKLSSMSYSSQANVRVGDTKPDLIFIVGGKDETERDALRHHIKGYISSKLHHSSNIIHLHLEATLSALVSCCVYDDHRNLDRNFIPRKQLWHSRNIELVLITRQGVHRFSDDQITRLMNKMD